jgi:hypothetical protein
VLQTWPAGTEGGRVHDLHAIFKMGSQEKWTTEFDLSWVAVVCTHQIFSKSFKKTASKMDFYIFWCCS